MPIHSHLLTYAGELFGGLRDSRANIAAVSGEASRIGGSGHRIISHSDCRPLEGATRSTPDRGASQFEVLRATSHAFSCSSVSASASGL
jgi:hypothetical protein